MLSRKCSRSCISSGVVFFLISLLLSTLSAVSFVAAEQSTPTQDSTYSLNYIIHGEDNGPFQVFTDTSLGEGFISELMAILVAEENATVKPLMRPIKRIKRGLAEGKFKPWITYGMEGWRELPAYKNFHFSKQVLLEYRLSQILYGDQVVPAKALTDFRDCRVLLIRGFNYGPLFAKLKQHGANVIYADSFEQALKMLKYGRADIFLGFDLRVNYVLRKMNWQQEDFRTHPFLKGTQAGNTVLMMSEDVPVDFVRRIEQRLQTVIEDRRWQEILQRY
jgi:ABC-type amino acid transport substrate-binding protein